MTHTHVLAALTPNSGQQITSTVLGIVASLALAVLGARLLTQFVDDRYGKMIAAIGGGALVIGVCVFPDVAMNVLKGLFTSVFGGS